MCTVCNLTDRHWCYFAFDFDKLESITVKVKVLYYQQQQQWRHSISYPTVLLVAHVCRPLIHTKLYVAQTLDVDIRCCAQIVWQCMLEQKSKKNPSSLLSNVLTMVVLLIFPVRRFSLLVVHWAPASCVPFIWKNGLHDIQNGLHVLQAPVVLVF